MISIVLPTAKRPEMLRTALRSIAHQTAASEIAEIIVSENGEDPRSGAVCGEFPGLPITYIFREKPLPRTDHATALFRGNLKGEFTAMLHDDDWWAPGHLENALSKLKVHSTASAYYSSYFKVSGESSPLDCYDNFFFWFGAGYPPLGSPWLLDQQAVLLASLLGTGACYSSLVARTAASYQAAAIYAEKNAYDNDRMIAFALAKQGPLVYDPTPQVYYRVHAEQDNWNKNDDQRNKQMEWTTAWLVRNGGGDWEKIGDLFAMQASKCPLSSLPILQRYTLFPWCLPLFARHAAPQSPATKLYQTFNAHSWKNTFKQWTPPALIAGARALFGKS